jgi:hypothetical protein
MYWREHDHFRPPRLGSNRWHYSKTARISEQRRARERRPLFRRSIVRDWINPANYAVSTAAMEYGDLKDKEKTTVIERFSLGEDLGSDAYFHNQHFRYHSRSKYERWRRWRRTESSSDSDEASTISASLEPCARRRTLPGRKCCRWCLFSARKIVILYKEYVKEEEGTLFNTKTTHPNETRCVRD